jgi:hypothetical protein
MKGYEMKKHLSNIRLFQLAALLLLGGCATQTQFVRMEDKPAKESQSFSRTVEYRLSNSFFKPPPDCVVVMPFQGKGSTYSDSKFVESALERHLIQKIPRVVGPVERSRLSRNLALDPLNIQDRKALGKKTGCEYFLFSKSWGSQSTYVVFWAQEQIGMDLQIVRGRDKTIVWRGRHVASRSEGGAPLSLVGAPFQAFSAGRFQSDNDIGLSLVDDVVRRIFRTLPDARFGSRVQRKPAAGL